MKVILIIIGLLATIVSPAQTTTSDVWINEFHYDHATTRGDADTAEFMELAIKNSIVSNATELAKYSVIFYTSGALDPTALDLGRGLPYNVSSSWYTEGETVHSLSTFSQCPVSGSGFTLLYKKLTILQDVPAAIALVYNNSTVIQLLSYEKAFKIAPASRGGGVAAGMSTSLVTKPDSNPASETALSDPDHSVSLLGTGSSYNNFQWDDGPTVRATRCALNTNGVVTQSFATTLPLHWLSFVASSVGDKVNVQWKVADNGDVSSYIVELSPINAAFKDAGSLAAVSNLTNYQSTINNVVPGTYKVRIKSVSKTGQIEYSETRVVRIGGGKSLALNVYPNPVKGNRLNVQIVPAENASYTVQLVDLNGKIISSKQTGTLQANTLNPLHFDVQNVSQGVYQLRLIGVSERQTIKVVISR